MPGSLVVVGTGIQLGQTTLETQAYIKQAEKVFYLVADPVTASWIKGQNPSSESLESLFQVGKHRRQAYQKMAETIMGAVEAGQSVCAVFYGHPGILVTPARLAMQEAATKQIKAKMVPGVSSADCLFADLGVDPGTGCQSFDATSFLLRRPWFDTFTILILWQVGVVGDSTFQRSYDRKGLPVLQEYLTQFYGPAHEVTLYEAAQFAIANPVIQKIPLNNLHKAEFHTLSTLLVPPRGERPVDSEMESRLGLQSPPKTRRPGARSTRS